MMRALKDTSDRLDGNLKMLQENGHKISQVLTCPETVKFEGEGDEMCGTVNTKFIIIYAEKTNEQ